MNDMGIGSWAARRARQAPGRTAFKQADATWSFREVEEDANSIARGLKSAGVERGDRVAFLSQNSVDVLLTLLGCAKIGAVFVPLNTRLAAPEVGYILGDCKPKVLIWGTGFDAIVESENVVRLGVRQVAIDDGTRESLRAWKTDQSADALDEPVSLDDLLMLQYTSGTSGHPKGVMLTHGNVTWNTFSFLVDSDLTDNDVALVMAPLFHTASLNMIFAPIFIKGGTCIIEPGFDPQRAIELIERERVTTFFGVTAMYLAMMQQPSWETADLSSARRMSCGAAPFPEPLLRRVLERGHALLQGYGLTEASPGVTILESHDSLAKMGSVGKPHFFTDVRIVRSDGSDAPPR